MYEAYLITNNVNGKRYVGMTKQGYLSRFKDHWWEANHDVRHQSMLHLDMVKYGIESFSVELLESGIAEEDHQEKERYYIATLGTYYENPLGYNMTLGGNGTVGYIFTDADRAKESEQRKGCTFSAERNAHIKEIMTGREYKQEWKDALSAARMGRFEGEENSFYGRHHSEATKQAIRNANSSEQIEQLDKSGCLVNTFFNLADAGRWVSENVSKAKYTTCATRIREVCVSSNPKCTAYGYRWRIKGRSID
jgi:group I intron endonuclease